MIKKIETIVFSSKPNLENMLAFWVLRKFGAENFRGLPKAKIVSRKTTTALYETDFVLSKEALGDDRPLAETVTSLCGCGHDLELEKFLQWCMAAKDNTVISEFLQKLQSISLAKAAALSTDTFNGLFADREKFVKPQKKPAKITAATLMKAVRVGKIPKERTIKLRHPNGEEKTLGFAVDDGPFKLDNAVDLAVVVHPAATNISIVSNFSIRSVIRILRVEELVRRQRSEKSALIASRMWKEFAEEGVSSLVPTWSYQKMQHGTRHVITSGVETPFTQLQIEEVVNLIRIAVDNRFQSQREHYCLRFRCTATVDLPCPWYHWMLGKCRQVRNAGATERQTIACERGKRIS